MTPFGLSLSKASRGKELRFDKALLSKVEGLTANGNGYNGTYF